jgi:hypothetical protein
MALFHIIKHDRKERIQQANLAANERHNYCFIYSGTIKQNLSSPIDCIEATYWRSISRKKYKVWTDLVSINNWVRIWRVESGEWRQS